LVHQAVMQLSSMTHLSD